MYRRNSKLYHILKHRLYSIQRNLEIPDTLGDWNLVHSSEGIQQFVAKKKKRPLFGGVRRARFHCTYNNIVYIEDCGRDSRSCPPGRHVCLKRAEHAARTQMVFQLRTDYHPAVWTFGNPNVLQKPWNKTRWRLESGINNCLVLCVESTEIMYFIVVIYSYPTEEKR